MNTNESFSLVVGDKINIRSKFRFIDEIGNHDLHIIKKNLDYHLLLDDGLRIVTLIIKGGCGVKISHDIQLSNSEYSKLKNDLIGLLTIFSNTSVNVDR